MVLGPFTPGFHADLGLAQQLAEIGVILLMFGVGIHFSLADLLAVRRIALPGAVVQIAVATLLGAVISHLWGWSWGSGIVFGLCLSVASTVVLLRAMESRGMLGSAIGELLVMRKIPDRARAANPSIEVVARAHSAEERSYLEAHGADIALVGEHELAFGLAHHALVKMGCDDDDADAAADELRRRRVRDATAQAPVGG